MKHEPQMRWFLRACEHLAGIGSPDIAFHNWRVAVDMKAAQTIGSITIIRQHVAPEWRENYWSERTGKLSHIVVRYTGSLMSAIETARGQFPVEASYRPDGTLWYWSDECQILFRKIS